MQSGQRIVKVMRGSMNFFQGGWGAGQTARKQSGQCCFFLVLNLSYSLQRGSNGFITEKTLLYQGSRGGPTFSRGVQMLVSKETHITCNFPGGSGPLSPPPPPPPSGSTHEGKVREFWSLSVVILNPGLLYSNTICLYLVD